MVDLGESQFPLGENLSLHSMPITISLYPSESIEFFLARRNSRTVFGTVVAFFRPHIHHKPDGQKVKVTDRNANFRTAEEKQRCCHFPTANAVVCMERHDIGNILEDFQIFNLKRPTLAGLALI